MYWNITVLHTREKFTLCLLVLFKNLIIIYLRDQSFHKRYVALCCLNEFALSGIICREFICELEWSDGSCQNSVVLQILLFNKGNTSLRRLKSTTHVNRQPYLWTGGV